MWQSFFSKTPPNGRNSTESVNEGMKIFKCIDCGKGYSQKGNLNRHIESVHEGKKLFKCNDCSTGFCLKWNMNKYIESVHEETKPT